MDTNTAFNGNADSNEVKKSLFDSVEVKGISMKRAKAFFSGRFAKSIRSISRLFSYTSTRVYGLAFLSFGILTLFLHLGEYYIMVDPAVEMSSLIIGAAFSVLSLLFLFTDKPISQAIQSIRFFDFIVFDFFSINRTHQNEEKSKINNGFGIAFGFFLALLGFVFPTEYSVLLILSLVLLVTAMVSPEFTYILSLLLFPYLPIIPYFSYVLALLIIVTLISFARKVFVGKRIYSFEIYDFLFLLLIFSVFITAVLLGGPSSTENALLTIIFLAGYFPASNLAPNRRLFDCVAGAISASAIPAGIYAIVSYVTSVFSGERQYSKAFFSSPEAFAAYLSAVAVFSLYLAVKRSRRFKKAYYFSVFILSVLAILTTSAFMALISLVFAMLALLVIRSKKIHPVFLFLLVVIPLAFFFLEDSVLLSVSDTFSISPTLLYKKYTAENALEFFAENHILGMGVNNPFTKLDFACNVFLALACRFGVVAFTVFALLLILRTFHFSLFKKYFSDSTVNFYAEISAITCVSILSIGSLSDVFSDIQMIYFFVVVFSVGSAALRISKKEKEEKRSYYKELGRSDLSAIDVTLKK